MKPIKPMAASAFLLGILCFSLVGYAKDLDTDEEGIWMIVEDQERYIRTSPRRIADDGLQAYLDDLVCEVAEEHCKGIRVYALQLPGFNASMMPNGAMFIQSGLLLRAESDSELASIIGHEIAHFTESHLIKNIRRWRKTANTFAVVGAIVSAAGTVAVNSASSYESASRNLDLSNTAIGMLETARIFATFQLIAYSRDDERQADVLGLSMIHDAGFNPVASSQIWSNYLEEHNATEKEGGFSILATHPSPESRFNELGKLAKEMKRKNIRENDSPQIVSLVDKYRTDWLEGEAQALHPEQFEALANRQKLFTTLPAGYLYYLQAKAWEKHAGKQMLGKRKRNNALESALKFYREGAKTESGLPTEAIRDWGRISKLMGYNQEAKAAFLKYITLAPDAWDAKFIRREIIAL